MPRIPLLGKGAARSRVEVTQTLTHCRFAAVPLGKGDNKSHFQQALCPPYQGGQPRSGRGAGFESLLPRAARELGPVFQAIPQASPVATVSRRYANCISPALAPPSLQPLLHSCQPPRLFPQLPRRDIILASLCRRGRPASVEVLTRDVRDVGRGGQVNNGFRSLFG